MLVLLHVFTTINKEHPVEHIYVVFVDT